MQDASRFRSVTAGALVLPQTTPLPPKSPKPVRVRGQRRSKVAGTSELPALVVSFDETVSTDYEVRDSLLPRESMTPARSSWQGAFSDEEFETLARGTKWHVVRASHHGWDVRSPELFNISDDIEAIIVRIEFPRLELSAEVFQGFRALDCELPPIIAVLSGVPMNVGSAVLVDAQRWLRTAGADRVLQQCGEASELRISVALSLEQLHYEYSTRQQLQDTLRGQLEQVLRAEYEQRLQQKLERRQREAREMQNELFWQHVHKLYSAFPALEAGLPRLPEPDAEVGPCQLGHSLGRGGFGEVYKALNLETMEGEAVKAVMKSRLLTISAIRSMNKELSALGRLNHPNIVKLHGSVHGPCHIFIRMELAGERNLHRHLKAAGGSVQQEVAQEYQAQLVDAIAHCHSRAIAHRDLKPENIAVSNCGQQIKLLDFGCAAVRGEPCFRPAGTMPFMAPEMMMVSDKTGYEPAGCDVWATGVVLLEMLCGLNKLLIVLDWPRDVNPEKRRCLEFANFFDTPGALEKALHEDLDHVPEQLVQLLRGVLEVDPARRWTAGQTEECQWLNPDRYDARGTPRCEKAASAQPAPTEPRAARSSGKRPLPLQQEQRSARAAAVP